MKVTFSNRASCSTAIATLVVVGRRSQYPNQQARRSSGSLLAMRTFRQDVQTRLNHGRNELCRQLLAKPATNLDLGHVPLRLGGFSMRLTVGAFQSRVYPFGEVNQFVHRGSFLGPDELTLGFVRQRLRRRPGIRRSRFRMFPGGVRAIFRRGEIQRPLDVAAIKHRHHEQ